MKLIGFLVLLFVPSLLIAVVLEDKVVSESDIKRARNIRDNTEAPKSLVGGAAAWVAKTAAEGAKSQAEACQRGNCDFVIVNFEVVSGLSPEGVDRKFSMTPVEQSTGRIELNASKNGASISKALNPSVAGHYQWNASWDHGRKACAGQTYVSGKKGTLNIRVYTNCSDAGTNEY